MLTQKHRFFILRQGCKLLLLSKVQSQKRTSGKLEQPGSSSASAVTGETPASLEVAAGQSPLKASSSSAPRLSIIFVHKSMCCILGTLAERLQRCFKALEITQVQPQRFAFQEQDFPDDGRTGTKDIHMSHISAEAAGESNVHDRRSSHLAPEPHTPDLA